MKDKIRSFSLLALLLFLAGLSSVWGERFSFQANGGIAFPTEENMKSGVESGFGFAFPLHKKIMVSFNFGFWKSKVKGEAGKLLDGKLSVTPFLASIQYSLFENKVYVPYVFAGASLVFSNFREEYLSIPEVTINQKVENGPGVQAGFGGQLHLSKKLALFAEVLYLYREARGITTISDMNLGVSEKEFSLNMSAYLLWLGIKFYL